MLCAVIAFSEPTLGALAATGTAFCWALAALFFTNAARRIGQFSLNQIRLLIAIVLLTGACAATGAFIVMPLPQVALLGISGFAGLTLGDAAYFYALQTIGPRRGALVLSLHPVFTALLAMPLLGEGLSWVGVAGMVVTLLGVAWVVLERGQPGELRGSLWLGVLGATIGAVGQAVGAIFAKAGLGFGAGSALDAMVGLNADSRVIVHPLLGTLTRMVCGFVPLILFAAAKGALAKTLSDTRNGKAMASTLGGAVFGPFIGVSLSLYALTKVDSYIAATLFATAPVLIIPLVRVFYKEVISARALLGALVACAGVALLTAHSEFERLLGL